MADSDGEYDGAGSDDEVGIAVNGAGPSARQTGRSVTSRPRQREQARWEAAATSNWELQGADGSLEGMLGGLEEAGKRRRYAFKSI